MKSLNKSLQNIFISVILISLSGCGDDNPNVSTNWQLVWEDDFNGNAGEAIDGSNWNFDIGTDWGNAQLEYDTDRTENVSLDGNGNLAITAREESYMGSAYTSGRITTKGKFEQAYGRIEARIQLPFGQGIWPAFWLLGSNIDAVSWPQCGEIDIMEYRGQEPTKSSSALHGPGYSGGNPIFDDYTLPNGRFDIDFHIFSVEWFADRIDFFVDDFLFHRVKSSDVPGEWVYDHPFFIILNVAVGGTFVGPPNGSTLFPQTMLVDWVRVYQAVD